jgi:putative MFS transporter
MSSDALPSHSFASAAAQSSSVTAAEIASRIERLPICSWHVKVRLVIGVATFFDAFDALTIAQVLPVLAPMWKLSGAQIGFLISVGYLGQLLGALFFGWLAERIGRVRAIALCVATFAGMSIACSLAWNYESLLVFRTIQGFGLGGEVPIAAVYISEITRAKGRGRFVLLYELIFSVGVVAAGVLGYWLVPSLGWQAMFLIGASPLVLIWVLLRHVPESPRWLASHGRLAEADATLAGIEEATRTATGQPLPPAVVTEAKAPQKPSWRDLFGPLYLRRTIVVWFIWFGSYIVYYGIGTWLPTLYRTVFHLPLEQSLRYGLISNAIGFVGATLCALTIDYVGRRAWFALALAGSSVFLGILWLNGATTPQDVLIYGSGAYFFATAAAIGVYLYTPELYPTRVRAIGVSTATAWLRLASMAGPTIVGTMIGYGLGSVFLTFGLVALLAAVVVGTFAIETKGRILEEVSP